MSLIKILFQYYHFYARKDKAEKDVEKNDNINPLFRLKCDEEFLPPQHIFNLKILCFPGGNPAKTFTIDDLD
jgi:hypothetical protein